MYVLNCFSPPLESSHTAQEDARKFVQKNYNMSQHWDPSCLVLCQQWHKLGQNNAMNVSALEFFISITVSTMTQIGKKVVSTMCQHWDFPISIIVSTMTLIGEKLC